MPGNIDASFRVVKEKQNSPSRLMQWSAIKFEKKDTPGYVANREKPPGEST